MRRGDCRQPHYVLSHTAAWELDELAQWGTALNPLAEMDDLAQWGTAVNPRLEPADRPVRRGSLRPRGHTQFSGMSGVGLSDQLAEATLPQDDAGPEDQSDEPSKAARMELWLRIYFFGLGVTIFAEVLSGCTPSALTGAVTFLLVLSLIRLTRASCFAATVELPWCSTRPAVGTLTGRSALCRLTTLFVVF